MLYIIIYTFSNLQLAINISLYHKLVYYCVHFFAWNYMYYCIIMYDNRANEGYYYYYLIIIYKHIHMICLWTNNEVKYIYIYH